jgi:hypothetical protein
MHRGTKRLATATLIATVLSVISAIALFSMSDAQSGTRGQRAPAACRGRADDGRGDDGGDDDRRSGRQSATTSTTTATGHLLPDFSVGLAPTTFLRIDRRGRIVEAATNTSCRPTPGDTVYVAVPGGDIIEAPYLDLAAITWRGDFRVPAVYHRQDPQRGCLTPVPCVRPRR